MKIGHLVILAFFAVACMLSGCIPSSSERANVKADKAMYKPINYVNVGKKGPTLVVLPGRIKSNNASFAQKITSNNIADFGEMELSNANFGILERSDLGPMLDEISLAVNMGDPNALKKFKRGKFKSTKWFVKFDILKAEKVAQAGQGFDFSTISRITGILVGGTDGLAISTAGGSVRTADTAGVWIIGLRYKVMDASTSEQVTSGYFEEKMEVGAKATSVLGVSLSESGSVTLDTMVQRLVQKAVADLDKQK